MSYDVENSWNESFQGFLFQYKNVLEFNKFIKFIFWPHDIGCLLGVLAMILCGHENFNSENDDENDESSGDGFQAKIMPEMDSGRVSDLKSVPSL